MSLAQWMLDVAQILGLALMLAGGAALSGYLSGLVCDYLWKKLRDAHSMVQMQQAVREYKSRKDGGA